MACEQTYQMIQPPDYGVPKGRYFRPLVRENAMVQDAPYGWKLANCFLDMPAIAAATLEINGDRDQQQLALDGDQLSISAGNSVTLPAQPTPASFLSTDPGQSLVLGQDGKILAAAAAQFSDDQQLVSDNTGDVQLVFTPTTAADGQVNYSVKASVSLQPLTATMVPENDPAVPTQFLGTNDYYLGKPTLFAKVTIAGQDYAMPLYSITAP